MHQFRDKSGAQRELVSAGPALLPGAAGRRRARLPGARGAGRRGPARAPGAHARRRASASTSASASCSSCPRHRIPDGRRPRARPAGARAQDVDDRRHASRAPSTCSTSPTTIRRKFKRAVADSGREIVRRADKPGISNLIEIMAVARGVAPEEIEREFDGSGYGDFKTAVAEAVIEWLTPGARALRRAARRRRRSSRTSSRPAPTRRARSRAARSRTCARRWASGPLSGPSGPRLAFRVRVATIAHRLELDLDVFAGPFDLLLSLILREELDLLEVELAEIVIAYIDHLEAEGELDLEAATEFLVLIAALLELKSRLMLPGGEVLDELDELAPAEAAEELLERMLAVRALPRRGRLDRATRTPPARRTCTAPRRCRPRCAAVSLEIAERAYDPAVLGQAIGGLLRTPPPLDLRHMAMPRVSVGRAPGAPARACCAAAAVLVRRRGPGRRPRDGRGDAVRAAGALQERRGRMGAGSAVRADHGARAVMRRARRARSRRCCSSRPTRSSVDELADAAAGRRGRRRGGARASWPRRSRAAASSCARSPAAGRSPRTPTPRRPRGGCSPARARPRSRPPRPRRWRSSATCSRSRGRRSPASAASRPSRRPPRWSSAG